MNAGSKGAADVGVALRATLIPNKRGAFDGWRHADGPLDISAGNAQADHKGKAAEGCAPKGKAA